MLEPKYEFLANENYLFLLTRIRLVKKKTQSTFRLIIIFDQKIPFFDTYNIYVYKYMYFFLFKSVIPRTFQNMYKTNQSLCRYIIEHNSIWRGNMIFPANNIAIERLRPWNAKL